MRLAAVELAPSFVMVMAKDTELNTYKSCPSSPVAKPDMLNVFVGPVMRMNAPVPIVTLSLAPLTSTAPERDNRGAVMVGEVRVGLVMVGEPPIVPVIVGDAAMTTVPPVPVCAVMAVPPLMAMEPLKTVTAPVIFNGMADVKAELEIVNTGESLALCASNIDPELFVFLATMPTLLELLATPNTP